MFVSSLLYSDTLDASLTWLDGCTCNMVLVVLGKAAYINDLQNKYVTEHVDNRGTLHCINV